MTLTVHLPRQLGAALEAEAARRGQTPEQTAADLLAERLPLPGARRRLAFAAVGSSTSGRSAADADHMLAEGFGRDCWCWSLAPARWWPPPTGPTRTMPRAGR